MKAAKRQVATDAARRYAAASLWFPLPGPQTMAYFSKADELYYGGAAGGGKSDLLVGLALTQHRKTLLLRREAAQLPAIAERLRMTASGSSWSGSGGGGGGRMKTADHRSVELAGCKLDRDKEKYRGRDHDLKAFDELPEFTEDQYITICAWNRSVDPKQRCRRVGAGNPPSSSTGEWVIRRWGDWLDSRAGRKAKPGELLWYIRDDSGDESLVDGPELVTVGKQTYRPLSRTFIPAALADNRYLAATDYGSVLNSLPEPLRSQLKNGDFLIGRSDQEWQVIPTEWVAAAMKRWTPQPPTTLSAIGVDVARGGKAKTVLAPRHATWFAPLSKHPGKDTPDGNEVFNQICLALGDDDKALVYIDIIGNGSSPYDLCMNANMSNVRPFVASNRTDEMDETGQLRFRNLRAMAWWRLREALDPKNDVALALPPDEELMADLTSPRWSHGPGGILIEAKEDIEKRLHRSTDCGDAVVMAWYQPLETFWGVGFA